MRSTQLSTPHYGENLLVDVSYSNTGNAPIDVSDVKKWAKVDFTEDDSIISDLIDEVIDMVENELDLTIVDKTVTAVYEEFAARIALPFAPVDSITSVKTLDEGSVDETLTDGEDYYLQGNNLYLETQWKASDPWFKKGLEVVYDCSQPNLPAGIKLGLKKAILSNYEDRQDVVGGMSATELPNSSWKHLKRYKNFG